MTKYHFATFFSEEISKSQEVKRLSSVKITKPPKITRSSKVKVTKSVQVTRSPKVRVKGKIKGRQASEVQFERQRLLQGSQEIKNMQLTVHF